MDNLEVALLEPSEFNDPRRKVPRWYLHDGTTPWNHKAAALPRG